MTSRRESADINNQQRDFDYRRLYLSQLPRVVRNRSLDRYRQTLRTSSEEYGHFWTSAPYNASLLPPISASNNHHPQQLGTGSGAHDEFQMTSERNRVIIDDGSILTRPLLEVPYRPNWKSTNEDRRDDSRIHRHCEESNRRRAEVSSLISQCSRWGFRLAIDYVPLPSVSTDHLGFSIVNDVIRVDLQMHLNERVVTLKDVPFTFVKRPR